MAWTDPWATNADVLRAQLDEYGLGSLTTMVLGLLADPGATDAYILEQIRKSDAYRQRFPAMEALRQAGRAISEEAYREYEESVRETAKMSGIPESMFSSAYIANMMTNGVSAREFQQRIGLAAAAALTAPAETKQALRDLYGLEQSDLTTYWLDPDEALPLLVQRQQAAEIAGAGLRNNVAISREYAERLTAQGVATSDAARGFEAVAAQTGLTGEQGLTEQELIEAQFGDAQAGLRVEQARKSRRGSFEGGGGAAEAQQGVVGLATD